MIDYVKYNFEEILFITVCLIILAFLFSVLRTKKSRHRIGYYLNFIVYKLGLRRHISRRYISRIHVNENYEHLVELAKHPKIIIDEGTVEMPVLLRKRVAMKIYKVADKLPANRCLKIYSAFRSRILLYEKWNEEINRVQSDNLEVGRAELLSIVNAKVNNPHGSMGGHDSGGAVDLSICDNNGIDIDFGSKYHERYNKADLTKEQNENRKYLLRMMKSQGFVNHPDQWWHFSYGDRMWAAYKGKRMGGIYGSAEKEFENMGYVRIIKTDITSVNVK